MPPLLLVPACPLQGQSAQGLHRDQASRHEFVCLLAVQPWARESASLVCLNLLKRGSGEGGGLGVTFQEDCREDKANPGMARCSINNTFQFLPPCLPEHTLLSKTTQCPGPKWKTVRRREFRLCRLYKDFLSPSNSTGTVQNQWSPHQHVRCCDSASFPNSHKGKTDTLDAYSKAHRPSLLSA